MFIRIDPDATVATSSHTVCEFHKKYPFLSYAGCACTASWGQRQATPEEYKENRRKRLAEEALKRKAFYEFGF